VAEQNLRRTAQPPRTRQVESEFGKLGAGSLLSAGMSAEGEMLQVRRSTGANQIESQQAFK
jgi:hypothetical protein